MSDLEERTFIAIKPDGVQRGIIGEIIKRFEMKGFKLVGMKMLEVSNKFFFSLISNALTYIYLWGKGLERAAFITVVLSWLMILWV